MADLSDVTAALRQLCSLALYPGQNPPAGNSVAGMPVLVQSGWPDPKSLDATIAAKAGQVTIYPRPTERNTTRYPATQDAGALLPKTFTLIQAGQNISVGGAPPATYYRQNACAFVNGKPYIYSTQANDTPSTIAAGLAQLIAVDVVGTAAAGPVIGLPAPARVGALRVGTGAPTIQEVKRQEREFQIIVWAASPGARDAIAKPIDLAIAITPRISLADQTRGRLIYKGSPYTDFDQKQGIYRRDFIISVEYATTNLDFAPEVVAAASSLFLGPGSTLDVLGTEDATGVVTESAGQINISAPDLTLYN